MWSPFWKELTSSYQVVLFDNRGTGRSGIPDVPYSIGTMSNDVAGLMSSINLDRGHILGASMGGMIAQEFALNYPEKVESLILSMTSCGGSHATPVAAEVRNKIMQIANPSSGLSREDILKIWWSLIYTPEYVQKHISELVNQAMSVKYPTPPMTYRLQGEAMSKFDSYDRLPLSTCPHS